MHKSKDKIDYGEIIKKLRTENNMTQTELGELVSLGKTAISNYEIGYSVPSLTILENIAAVFGMSVVDFLMSAGDGEDITNASMPRKGQSVAETVIPYIKEENVKESTLEAKVYMDSSLVLPSFMTESDDGYICVKMPDNSMSADNILKNDYLLVKKCSSVKNRQLVLAFNKITNRYIIRRYIREGHIASLVPSSASEEYTVMRIDERDEKFVIAGYVESVFSKLR